MKTIKLKIEQNGGEYYGYAVIKNIPEGNSIIKGSKDISIGDIKIEFDELIEIVRIDTI
jgi:hypothetical protein